MAGDASCTVGDVDIAWGFPCNLLAGSGSGPLKGPKKGREHARLTRPCSPTDEKLLVVFCSQSYDLPALLGEIRTRAGDVPLIGCTTAGEIAASGPRDASVVVTALGGDGFAVDTAFATEASRGLREAVATVARCVPAREDLPHKVLLLLADGLAGDQQEIVRGAYGVLGAGVPLVGGCAGDDLKMTRTFQFHGDRVLTDSLAAAAGIHSLHVEQPADIRAALQDALAHPGPALVDLVTDPNALSIPPHITAAKVKGFALAATKIVLEGGVGRMLEMARANLRNVPRPTITHG